MRTYRITKEPSIKFEETYQECNVMRLEVPCSNFIYTKTIHLNIWSGENNFSAGGKEIKNLNDIGFDDKSIKLLNEQSIDLMNEVMNLLIQANKKELNELKGMIVFGLNKKGKEATLGEKIHSIKIPPQQLITINNKSYYELDEVVNKMLEEK